ncbi:MAG: ABC transporter [Oscillochloris sp.]|nr:ABC transporter [Oscillochloris sp.]
MNTLRLIRYLSPLDLVSVRRDPLLRWLVLVPLLFAIAARGLLPQLLEGAAGLLPFDILADYDVLMGCALLLLTPMMIGMIAGFLMLDLRDDGVLAALRITPPTLSGYLTYRLALPTLLGFSLTLIAFPIAGLPSGGATALVITAAAASLQGPLYALLLATFAANKVQGFALSKALGILMLAPLVSRYIPEIWQPLLAISPFYWPAQLYWALSEGGNYLGWLIGAFAYPLLIIGLLARRLRP